MPIDRAYAFIELSSLEGALAPIGYSVMTDEATASLIIDRPDIGSETVVSIGLRPSPAEQIRLVVCDACYPYRVLDEALPDLEESLKILSSHLPFGRIESGPDRTIHYGWTLATDADTSLDADLTVTSIVMFDLVQQHFGDYIEGICNGDIPVSILDRLIEHAGDAE